MLSIPIYIRGSSYYLHVRLTNGQQFKRSLHTSNKTEAIIRASRILELLKMADDVSKLKKYEIDLKRGIFKSEGHDDHMRMMDAVERIGMLPPHLWVTPSEAPQVQAPAQKPDNHNSLTLTEVLDKFMLLKTVRSGTATAYKNTVKEFVLFHKSKCFVSEIMSSDFSRYQEHLAEKGNTTRTIDNKIANLKAVLNFAVGQGYIQKNPIQVKNLQSKSQKLSQGYLIFEVDEIKHLYTGNFFKEQKNEDLDYYYCMLLELFTGCRVSELTSLTKSQIKKSDSGNYFIQIREAKTQAGTREIPLPKELFTSMGFEQFYAGKNVNETVFRYVTREGRGSGNAVGKKFSRHMEAEHINRGKLVFHSLRKFLNDFFMKNGVEYEARCQFFGHEIESVNVAIYTNKYNVDQLHKLTDEPRKLLMKMLK